MNNYVEGDIMNTAKKDLYFTIIVATVILLAVGTF